MNPPLIFPLAFILILNALIRMPMAIALGAITFLVILGSILILQSVSPSTSHVIAALAILVLFIFILPVASMVYFSVAMKMFLAGIQRKRAIILFIFMTTDFMLVVPTSITILYINIAYYSQPDGSSQLAGYFTTGSIVLLLASSIPWLLAAIALRTAPKTAT
jgi:hypothetical protein